MRGLAGRVRRVVQLAAFVCCGGALGACSSQTAPSCTYTVNPASASVPASGAALEVVLSTGSACEWTAVSNASWMVLFVVPARTVGGATITAGVTSNTSAAPRTGTLTIAGQTVTVTQAGQQPVAVSGIVTEPMTGLGVGGVTVEIVTGPSGGSTTTGADGKYSLNGLLPGGYMIRIAKPFFGPTLTYSVNVLQDTTLSRTLNPQGRLPYTVDDVGAYWDGGGPYPNQPFRLAIYQDGTSVFGFYRAGSDVSGAVSGSYVGGRLTLRVPVDGAILTFDLTLDDARTAHGLVKDERFGGNFPIQIKR